MRIIGWIVRMIFLILIGLLFYISIPVVGEKNIHLEPSSIGGIIAQLSKKGYDIGIIDKYLMVAIGKPQSGWIYLGKRRLHRIDFLLRLTSAQSSYHKSTLIPGETTIIYMSQLAKTTGLDAKKLMDSYESQSSFREAGILAESYHIPANLKEKAVVRYLLNYSKNRYKKLSDKLIGSWSPKEWNRILTIASIIQKEAANQAEMPKVSSVIYNRLKKKMRLQMDGTLNYGQYSHIRVTPERIKTDKSTFNTYKKRGLPDYPVCSVSIAAISAAISPKTTEYLYFMKNKNGTHDFAKTYKSHLKNIQKRKSQ